MVVGAVERERAMKTFTVSADPNYVPERERELMAECERWKSLYQEIVKEADDLRAELGYELPRIEG